MVGVLQGWIGRVGSIGRIESKKGIAEKGIAESGGFPEELLGICRAWGASWGSLMALGELLCICVGSLGGSSESLEDSGVSLECLFARFCRPGEGKWHKFWVKMLPKTCWNWK